MIKIYYLNLIYNLEKKYIINNNENKRYIT